MVWVLISLPSGSDEEDAEAAAAACNRATSAFLALTCASSSSTILACSSSLLCSSDTICFRSLANLRLSVWILSLASSADWLDLSCLVLIFSNSFTSLSTRSCNSCASSCASRFLCSVEVSNSLVLCKFCCNAITSRPFRSMKSISAEEDIDAGCGSDALAFVFVFKAVHPPPAAKSPPSTIGLVACAGICSEWFSNNGPRDEHDACRSDLSMIPSPSTAVFCSEPSEICIPSEWESHKRF